MSRRTVLQHVLAFAAIVVIFLVSGPAFSQGNRDVAFERVREVQAKHTDRLLAIDGVEGTAIGYNEVSELALQVFTTGPGVAELAKTLDGVPVHIVVTGKLYALPKGGNPDKKPPKDQTDPTEWFPRPVPIGVSTGNVGECSSGTIGCRVSIGTATYALSNNHVYALEGHAALGSSVLQPGRYDTQCAYDEDDFIGTLAAFVPITFSTTANNTVDAAIALCTTDTLGTGTPSNGYGTPSSTCYSPANSADLLDLPVQKYGRTTGLTTGYVSAVNATTLIGYTSGTARFVGQIVITGDRGKFSNAGDSGSLIVTDDEGCNPVGLLFAGGARETIANPIGLVLSSWNVTIDSK